MKRQILPFNKVAAISSAALLLCLPMTGCDMPSAQHQDMPTYTNRSMPVYYSSHASKQLWGRLTNNFQLNGHQYHPRVAHFIRHYRKQNYHLQKVSEKASPYLYHIITELERQGLPAELALLPMIESAYHSQAISHKGAVGLWQIGLSTGHHLGLKHDRWYDGRKDVQASTQAALEYLSSLNKTFNNDWLLALAAYNAGAGRIKQAIKKNQALGRPTHYWALELPKETADFVPKFLAIAHVIRYANHYNIQLNPIENKPYFKVVDAGGQIDLQTAAHLAGVDIQEIKQLNPAYRRQLTHPDGPHQLLIPVHTSETFEKNLSRTFNRNFSNQHIRYVIKPGDTLSTIANKHNISIHALKFANQLKSDVIVVGRALYIPLQSPSLAQKDSGTKPPKS